MPEFSVDWTTRNVTAWEHVLTPWMGKPGVRMLEVGCFEGRSTLWFLEHVLTDPTSTMTVVDTFRGSDEHATLLPGYDWASLRARFAANVAEYAQRVRIEDDESAWVLLRLSVTSWPEDRFDLIYLDGSHRTADVLTDAVLAWQLLQPGGLLIFDDLDFAYPLPSGEVLAPAPAIQAFITCFGFQISRVQGNGLQAFVTKKTAD